MLGKLRKILHESCPDCENKVMELRVIESVKFQAGDETIYEEEDVLHCGRCGFETEYIDKKKRKPVRI